MFPSVKLYLNQIKWKLIKTVKIAWLQIVYWPLSVISCILIINSASDKMFVFSWQRVTHTTLEFRISIFNELVVTFQKSCQLFWSKPIGRYLFIGEMLKTHLLVWVWVKTKPRSPPGLPSEPLNCLGENKELINESKTQSVCYNIPPLFSDYSLIPSSQDLTQKKVWSIPFTQHISQVLFSISSEDQELFGNQQLGRFRKTYHFQVAWDPAIMFQY